MRCKRFFICFLISFSLLRLQAQNNLQFQHITTEDGLPSDYINCILQDKTGLLWIGTTDGLCKFDGTGITTYVKGKRIENNSNNNVTGLHLDSATGRLFCSTFWKGLNVWNPYTDSFGNFSNTNAKKYFPSNSLMSVKYLGNNEVVVTQGAVIVLNVRTGHTRIIQMPLNTWSERKFNQISKVFSADRITIDRENNWWLFGDGCVYYNPRTNQAYLFGLGKNVPAAFNNTTINDCKEDVAGNVWFASGSGLYLLNKKSNKLTRHFPDKFKQNNLNKSIVNVVLPNEDGTIYIGTEDGLFYYNPVTEVHECYRNNPLQSNSISDNFITALYRDRQGIIWVGTQHGLNAIYPHSSPFKVYQNIPGNKNTLNGNNTGDSYLDNNGNTWVGTNRGLECIEANGSVKIYVHGLALEKPFMQYHVKALLPLEHKYLFVGTWGNGIQMFDMKKRQFVKSFNYSEEKPNISSNFIKSMCFDSSKNIWVGTWNGGIMKYQPKENKFETYNTTNNHGGNIKNFISRVYYDGKNLWAGEGKGILKYDTNKDCFREYIISEQKDDPLEAGVAEIASGSNNILWLGTFMGLTRFDISSGRFKKLPIGFSVIGILNDSDTALWLATNQGLKHYFLRDGHIDSYSLADGLPVSYFPVDVYFRQAVNGDIYINSNSGLIYFSPKNIWKNQEPPQIINTVVTVDNKPYSREMYTGNKLALDHNQQNIHIKFAALNLISPSNNQYAYKLQGFDKDWTYSGNRSEATYTNLPAGDYVFLVKAANNSGVWTSKPSELNITIERAWWRTWWFYTLCVLVFLAIVYAFYRQRIKSIIAEQALRNKIARDLHDDIGSTLSGIKLFSTMALQKLEKEKSEAAPIVERIGERSEKMIDAMSDIVWSIQPRHDELEDMLVRMKHYAAEMLEPKNILFHFMVNENDLKGKISSSCRKEIYLVFKEAINNIVKHAGCTEVRVELKLSGKRFYMTIADDGKGFEVEKKNGGNGLFNLQERATRIKGTISICSEKDRGTVLELGCTV
jgi:ligand-binding sensor domain-containing protein/two-component sensor histidine kinase